MVVVIWIDWYPYHMARFRALASHGALRGRIRGIELVGGTGVHTGLVFRERSVGSDEELLVDTLAPNASWSEAGQRNLALATWRRLEEINPDVVLVPGYYTAPALAAALWSKLRGRRTVLMTESTQGDHPRQRWKELLKSGLLRSLFDWAVAGGDAHVRYLQALQFSTSRIARHYDVVDNRFFEEGARSIRENNHRADWGLPEKFFLYVGRLAAEKNADGLLRAYEEYRCQGGMWSLVLAGDGPERSALEAVADSLGISDCVRFAGQKTSRELLPFYALASCFVLPSRREPWGLVVNEAMAAGLPVIVSSRCGCAENLVEDGRNGYVFDPFKPDELSLRLKLMGRDAGPVRLRDMGERSREVISGYSLQKWADEIARIVAA